LHYRGIANIIMDMIITDDIVAIAARAAIPPLASGERKKGRRGDERRRG
jgi:hypothetical protein